MKIVEPSIKPVSKIDGNEALKVIQRCAKTCYKSYSDKDDIESAKKLVRMLIASGHHSMLENYIITMNYVSNIAAYKDLTRHRLSSFSVESSRFCNYDKDKFGNEIKFLCPVEIQNVGQYAQWVVAMQDAEDNYMKLAKMGAKPDQLSLLLPQSTAAEFNLTANLREWRHIFNLRLLDATGKARPCIKEIMEPTLCLFHKEIPVVFDDQYEQLLKQKSTERTR